MQFDNNESKVAVLIPYFQRRPGILEGTVRSVFAQQGFSDYQVIVVDDGSPVSAESELANITENREKITIIKQANAGPGAARNTALDHVPADACYIAFLDSDDQLEPSYLADAVFSLNKGYDLFFGNSRRDDIEKSRFEWDAVPSAILDLARHRLIDEDRQLYEFQGDFFDFVVFRSNIIGPSTMAYRSAAGAGVRFNEQIYNGQDRVFKLSLCKQIKKITFSPKIYAQEGKGINIFDSAGWGSERSLALLSSYIDMCKYILGHISMNERQTAHVRQHLARTRYTFTASMLHSAKQRKKIDWRVVGKTFASDPATVIWFLPNAVKVAVNKVRVKSS
jgi:succinoglycan biosynthesis protein ExoW